VQFRKLIAVIAPMTVAALPACQSIGHLPSAIDPNPNSNSIRDLAPPGNVSSGGPGPDRPSTQADHPRQEELNYGTARFFEPSGEETTANQNETRADGQNFVFRDAPIDAVLNQVFGDGFGLNYAIDPSISGTLTLRLDGISTPEEAVAGLGAALRLQGLEITEQNGAFLVARAGQAGTGGGNPVFLQSSDILPSGTSLAVLQLRFASVEEVTKIARAMLPPETIRYSDETRGLVVLSGQPEEVSAAVQLLKSLDVNWLSSVSTALIPVENARPSEIAADLDPILSRMGGVSIIPINRLETLMVIARQRESLDQARSWIARLDQDARPQLTRDILVYEARYVNAEELLALTGSSGTKAPQNFPTAAFSSPSGVYDPLSGGASEAPLSSVQEMDNVPAGASLYAGLSIRVDPGRNAIVARGDSSELQSLSELLSLLDKPKRQVLIQATIVEVSLSDGTSLGVQWDLVQDQLAARFTDTSSGEIAGLYPGVSVSYINTDVAAVLNALATTSDVEIVSSPRMLVLNNETAKLQIGDQVPIITQSAVSVANPDAPIVNSTTYRDTGVILTVTPRIRAGGMVEIDVSQEVSGVSETTTSNIDSPTISQRSVESVLAVPDGSTAILGGLMSSTRSYSQSGIPILKDVPVIGSAFRSTSQTKRRTELVVLIEPTVVAPESPAEELPARLRAALMKARQDQAS
jgi:general secretion pathway protein D